MYFAKVNLNSKIFDVMDNPPKLDKALEELYERIDQTKTSYYYQEDTLSKDDWYYEKSKDPEAKKNLFRVKFIHLEKNYDQKFITGRLTKIYKDDLDEYNEETDDVTPVSSSGDLAKSVTFYFDVKSEWVAFAPKRGFGHAQFQRYFQSLINECHGDIVFELVIQSNVDKFKEQLKQIAKALEMKVSLVIPNNSREDFEALFVHNSEEIENLEATKIEQKYSASLKSNGLNLKSDYVERVIDGVEKCYGVVAIEGRKATNEKITVATNKTLQTRWIKDTMRDSIPAIKEYGGRFISEIQSKLQTLRQK